LAAATNFLAHSNKTYADDLRMPPLRREQFVDPKEKRYRDKAEACRQSAKATEDARAREGWLRLADQWTRLADEAAWAAALR
jgi:hypothetical protein